MRLEEIHKGRTRTDHPRIRGVNLVISISQTTLHDIGKEKKLKIPLFQYIIEKPILILRMLLKLNLVNVP